MKTGAQILLDCLKREGVDTIFGYPGARSLLVHDALMDDADIRHILVRHEQGAAHAADGYARTTGKVGVCLTTSGPGATNLVTGIATAYMDSIPIVAITGQVKSFLIGNDAFQEADITGITRPITKHNYLVKEVKDLARIVRERDPGEIGLNISRTFAFGDGLTHREYLRLAAVIGDELMSRTRGAEEAALGSIRRVRRSQRAA